VSARQRQQKRKTGRSPAVWRGEKRAVTQERATVDHGVRDEFGVSWRAVSGLIVIVLTAVLVVFFVTDLFYVRNVTVVGAQSLDRAEVFRFADIAESHVFWIDPAEVRQSIIESSPVVADARVTIGWPPELVKISIVEREPAVVWTQSGVSALVDLHGNVLRNLPSNEGRPDLMHIIVDAEVDQPPLVGEKIPEGAINGALQLRTLLAGLQVLRYNPTNGLAFREPGGWDVWLGVGTDMANKLIVYEAMRDDLISRGITPVLINVANPEGAYYCGSFEACYE